MGETYGLPEPVEESTVLEQAQTIASEVMAGQTIVRTVALYALLALGIAGLAVFDEFEFVFAFDALACLVFLLASDRRLA